MLLSRRLITLIALFATLPVAHADNRKIYSDIGGTSTAYRTWNPRVVTPEDPNIVAVSVDIQSDAGEEELPLVESNAYLHGGASIEALPVADAGLALTLYDAESVAVATFSGTLGKDGTVSLTSDGRGPDIEVLAVEVFSAAKGYELGIGLAGADTYDVAYATVTVTEGSPVCVATDEKGNCLKWDTSNQVSTRAEVGWDTLGVVWEGEATSLTHEGQIEVKAKTYDAEGRRIEVVKSKMGVPWLDGGEGVTTLATDEDPLTRVALHRGRASVHAARAASHHLCVVSEGWTDVDALPVDAEVELTDGDTLIIPVNSYQRTAPPSQAEAEQLFSLIDTAQVRLGVGTEVYSMDVKESGFGFLSAGEPICGGTTCVTILDTDEGYEVAVTVYAEDATELPEEVEVSLSIVDAFGMSLELPATVFALDEDITAVFANEVSFVGDPVGLGLAGKVSLLGTPNRKGKQDTLAKGKFYAELARDADGDLELAGGDKDVVVSSGEVVRAGAAVGLTGDDDSQDSPPVILYGNGSGTKNATTTTSAKPQLL